MEHKEGSVKRKVIVLNAYIKKVEKPHTSELTEHLKTIEQKEANTPRKTKQQEIIKWRSEINKMKTSRKSTKWTNLYPN